jgi:hypothetical protein
VIGLLSRNPKDKGENRGKKKKHEKPNKKKWYKSKLNYITVHRKKKRVKNSIEFGSGYFEILKIVTIHFK